MLHICYILPIFRIKKAPIGAVACPQWIHGNIIGNTEKSYPIAFKNWCTAIFVHIGDDSSVNIVQAYASDLSTLRLNFNHQTSNEFKAIIIGQV